jgi:hypothetical protein
MINGFSTRIVSLFLGAAVQRNTLSMWVVYAVMAISYYIDVSRGLNPSVFMTFLVRPITNLLTCVAGYLISRHAIGSRDLISVHFPSKHDYGTMITSVCTLVIVTVACIGQETLVPQFGILTTGAVLMGAMVVFGIAASTRTPGKKEMARIQEHDEELPRLPSNDVVVHLACWLAALYFVMSACQYVVLLPSAQAFPLFWAELVGTISVFVLSVVGCAVVYLVRNRGNLKAKKNKLKEKIKNGIDKHLHKNKNWTDGDYNPVYESS